MFINQIKALFHIDMVSMLMVTLISFIGLMVYSFSKRYMKGDSRYTLFFTQLLLLCVAAITVAISDHLLMFLAAWALSNFMLVKLMIHKPEWRAARASGTLAGKNFLLGLCLIALAFSLLYLATNQTSIQAIIQTKTESICSFLALMLLLLAAMTQSAIWPFHRWLISSLNSPTPVSAIMHAGLVNGGGFLLIRFSPLYLATPDLLTLIFTIGMISALMGTLWMLIQHNVKRMLACSTMGQMGFMLAQCGLGLFPAAMAHLCWHGIFKAYLFFTAGSTIQEKRFDPMPPPKTLSFSLALLCGAVGSYIFALTTHKTFGATDTTQVLLVVAFITGSQLALQMLQTNPLKMLPLALAFTSIMAGIYGGTIRLIEITIAQLNLVQPQPLNSFHIIGITLLLFSWLFILFVRPFHAAKTVPNWALNLYVKTLNASQPHPSTVTTHRNHYKCV